MINSFAIALIAKSDLGVGAISCVAYVLAEASGLSFGTFTFIVNILFIAGQVALLRRDFKPVQFLQVIVNIVFSSLIDVSALVLSPISLTTLPAQAVALAVGCFLLALGVMINSFAIALIAKSDLGVGAISCVAYVLAATLSSFPERASCAPSMPSRKSPSAAARPRLTPHLLWWRLRSRSCCSDAARGSAWEPWCPPLPSVAS